MANLKIFVLNFSVIALMSLNLRSQTNTEFQYDVEIQYLNFDDTKPSYCGNQLNLNDSLPIFFEAGFYDDIAEISINDTIIFSKNLISNESTGTAGLFTIEKFIEVDEFRLRLNNGKWILVVTDRKCCLIGVNMENRNKVKILFYNYYPIHY